MLSFNELLTTLHDTHPQPNPNYYILLIEHAETIVMEVALKGQSEVAQKLGMVQSKLSNYLPLLKAVANDKRSSND